MRLSDYHLFAPPVDDALDNLSREKAVQYFTWFCNQIPERLHELACALRANGGQHLTLDFSPASLTGLQDWFRAQVTTVPLTPAEIAEELASIPEWLHHYAGGDELSEETFSLCVDIGIYLGETMRHSYPTLRWELLLAPDEDVDFHNPVLTPFQHNLHFNPVSCVITTASRYAKGDKAEPDLSGLYQCWAEYVMI